MGTVEEGGSLHTASLARYEQVADFIGQGILTGKVELGSKLPSVRELQRTQEVSKNTALAALRLLETKGFAIAKPRSGYFASKPQQLDRPAALVPQRREPSGSLSDAVVSIDGIGGDSWNLGEAILHEDLLPVAGLNRAMKSVLTHHSTRVFGKLSSLTGAAELRAAIAVRMHRGGANVDENEILITSGATESVSLALQVLTQPGDSIAVECPCFFGTRGHAVLGKLTLEEISTSPVTGLDVDYLEEVCRAKTIKAVLVSANVHNPTGACMPNDARQRLLDLSLKYDFWIIEDDVYGDYARYSGPGCSSLKAMDKYDRVLYCSSFSKTISPGIRCGWIASQPHYAQLLIAKTTRTLGTPAINQLALAKYISTASIENHISHLVKTLDQTRAKASQLVASSFPPGTQAAIPRYGFLLWIKLPASVSVDELASRCRELGILFMTGPRFGPTEQYRQFIRLNIGRRWDEKLELWLTTMGAIATELAASQDAA